MELYPTLVLPSIHVFTIQQQVTLFKLFSENKVLKTNNLFQTQQLHATFLWSVLWVSNLSHDIPVKYIDISICFMKTTNYLSIFTCLNMSPYHLNIYSGIILTGILTAIKPFLFLLSRYLSLLQPSTCQICIRSTMKSLNGSTSEYTLQIWILHLYPDSLSQQT